METESRSLKHWIAMRAQGSTSWIDTCPILHMLAWNCQSFGHIAAPIWQSLRSPLQHARGAILRSEEKMNIENRDSIRFAINKAVDKLHRQIDRFKSKRISKNQRVRDKYRATVAELDLAEEVPQYDEPEAADTAATTDIVRRKTLEMIPMNEEEAIEQLELLDHNFYMFMNADTEQINVLYRREVGGYGLLVLE